MDVKPLPYHVIQKECWYNKIFVRVVPTMQGYTRGGFPVKLNLEMNGKIAKFGQEEYKQNSKKLHDTIERIYRTCHDAYIK